MFNPRVERVDGLSGYHAMIVIGDLYVQERWEIRKVSPGEKEIIGRRDFDMVSGVGAIVATMYSQLSHQSTRLITVMGRDVGAQRIREWNATQRFDLVPTVVVERTGRRVKVINPDGTVKCQVTDSSNNLLLSQSMVSANLENWGEAVCLSLNMGTNTLQTVIESAEKFSALYISGSFMPISNYHLLKKASIVFLTVSQVEILWGKEVVSRDDLSVALTQIAKLGMKTICTLVSTADVALYSGTTVSWYGDGSLSMEKDLDDFVFGLYIGWLITAVESGMTLSNAVETLIHEGGFYQDRPINGLEYSRIMVLPD
ncbi:hypothetical protein [Sulfobacillus sp. hq2]|uniref:hypothetical protein n=1 Tax=Sulfobacillus TaxID=28033 RepID=UPI000CD11A19|nr:hypothetical protein [Sulfobacillus sp. hq2]POB11064.1 hypothetical protein CO251_05815 [Sulfobacillus sp. hq2]